MGIEDKVILIANSGFGQYVPQMVTETEIDNENWDWSDVSQEDIDCLLGGPITNEWYWDAWNNAMNNIRITSEGHTYYLMHNEDLWAVREDATEEELEDWII